MHADAAVTGLSRTPATALRNTVQPLADIVNVTLKSKSGQTANHIEGRSFASVLQWSISAVGAAAFASLIVSGTAALGATTVGGTLGVTGVATFSVPFIVSTMANRIPYANGSGLFSTSSALTYDGTTFVLGVGNTITAATGAATFASTVGITGVTTLTTLAGSGDRLVIASATGVLGETTAAAYGLVSGTGVIFKIAFWSSSSTITSSTDFYTNLSTIFMPSLSVTGAASAGSLGVAGSVQLTAMIGASTRFVTVDATGFLGTTTISGSGGVLGTSVANRVAYWSATDTITGSANLTFSGTALVLTGTQTISSTLGVTGIVTLSAALTWNNTGAGADWTIWRSAGAGLVMRGGAGSSYDLSLMTPASTYLIRNPTGTQQLEFPGTGLNTFSGAVSMTSTLAVTSNVTLSAGMSVAGRVSIGSTIPSSTGLEVTGNLSTTGTGQIGIRAQMTMSSAATSTGKALYAILTTTAAAFTMSTGYGIHIDSPSVGAGSAITTLIGLDVSNQTAGASTNLAIRTGTGALSFGDNVHITLASGGYWINNPGTYTYGMYVTGTSLAFRSGSASNYLTVNSSGQPTYSTAVTMSSTLNVTGLITGSAGATITGGPIILGSDTVTQNLRINGPAATDRQIRFLTASVNRWLLSANNTAETGSDAGSDFTFNARSDAGASIDNPITITRAAGGAVTIARPLAASSTLAVTSTQTNSGDLVFTQTNAVIRGNTSDGSDNHGISIVGGGADSSTRGAGITVYGNEYVGSTGYMDLVIGNVTGALLRFSAGGSIRGTLAQTGEWTFISAVSFSSTLAATGQFISSASGGGSSAGVMVSGAAPALGLRETDQASDGQYWDILANGGVLSFRVTNNANSTSSTGMTMTRSGATITGVAFPVAVTMSSTLAVTSNITLGTASASSEVNRVDNSGRLILISGTANNAVNGAILRLEGADYTGAGLGGNAQLTAPSIAKIFTVGLTVAITGGATIAGAVGIGGTAASAAQAVKVQNNGLTGTSQYGIAQNGSFTSSATVAGVGIYSGLITAASAFTMADGYGVYIDTGSVGAGSAVTRLYGLYVASQAAGGTNYAIYTNAGRVRFGDTTDTTAVASANAAVNILGGLSVAKSVWSASYFLSELTAKNAYVINGAGSNFGFISNVNTTTWSLSWGGVQTTLGTAALTWNTSGAVTVAGTLAVTSAITATGGIIFNGGGSTLNHYEVGSYTATLTGCTTSPTVTVNYTRIGNMVFLSFASSLTATSNTSACTITGAPSAIRPATAQGLAGIYAITDGGGTIVNASATDFGEMGTGGTIVLYRASNANGFSAGANKGMRNSQALGAGTFTCCYLLT